MTHCCNNCGEPGHILYNCKFPIVSYGIILYDDSYNEPKYLMICRKDSLGFVDFVRGKYNVNDEQYILNLLSEMTVSERSLILNNDFDKIWNIMWNIKTNRENKRYTREKELSKDKFNKLDIKNLISKINTKWTEPEWGFPKGRKNINERNLNAAIREFREETGYSPLSVDIVDNLVPFTEIFTGSNYKSYKHCYYLAKFNKKYNKNNGFQKSEISDMKWLTYSEAKKKIRPYNLEKLELLKNINTIINNYIIYK